MSCNSLHYEVVKHRSGSLKQFLVEGALGGTERETNDVDFFFGERDDEISVGIMRFVGTA